VLNSRISGLYNPAYTASGTFLKQHCAKCLIPIPESQWEEKWHRRN
jgi:hypothetical protein